MKSGKIILVKRTHAALKQIAETVVAGSDEAEQVIKQLQQYMKENPKCQGIAANQIGISKRIFIMRYKDATTIVMNPELIWKFGRKKSLERCQSINGCFFVKRPLFCKVRWQNTDGLEIHKILWYKKARIFMHELDHLNGLCIDDIGRYWRYSRAAESIMAKEAGHGKNLCNLSKV